MLRVKIRPSLLLLLLLAFSLLATLAFILNEVHFQKVITVVKDSKLNLEESWTQTMNNSSSVDPDILDTKHPKRKLGNAHKQPTVAVGIPSARREGVSYLNETMSHMLSGLTFLQRLTTVFVIYIADDSPTYFDKQTDWLKAQYPREFEDGIIEVISPPHILRPNWENELLNNFGDPPKQRRWRSKQNLDMAFLIGYIVETLDPEYFLMMEDDVAAAPNYMSKMLEFAEAKDALTWTYCTFTEVGGAGKLFHRQSTRDFAVFVSLFWNAKPLDWLYWDFNRNKRCGYGETLDQCKKKANEMQRKFGEDLFAHLGKVSSRLTS